MIIKPVSKASLFKSLTTIIRNSTKLLLIYFILEKT